MTATTATRSIPFFNYPKLYAEREEEYVAAIRDVLSRGAYIMQKDLAEFEESLARLIGVKHAIGVADGTNAIILGLKAAGVGPGDEVILPSHTFVATASAVNFVGGIPVLADCGRDHLIDAASVERLITDRTKVIMPVQLNGRTANMDPLLALATKHGLKIVEDSCQALGSRFKDRYAGTFGVAGAFSFYPSKTLGAFGDAGAVVTDDDEAADLIKLIRDHGRGADGKVKLFGLNSRLDNLQAAILNLRLQTYEQDIARRRAIASMYDERLSGLSQLLLPPAPGSENDHFDIFQNYEIEADDRDGLRTYLEGRGVRTIIQWGGHTIHQFDDLKLRSDASYTEAMTQRFMLLPMNTSLSDDDIGYICDCINAFYRR